MKDIYEMPQMAIVELEVQGVIMDPTGGDGGGTMPGLGE